MKIIAISGKARHGKDTTAKFMAEELEKQGKKVLVAHFGDLLKYICTKFFNWDGQKDEKGRTLLQYVGTDQIRAQSPDYWANFIVGILSLFPNEWDYVLLPDTRFPNEYEIFGAYGMDASLLRVERPGFKSPLTPEQQLHPSETALDGYPCHCLLINNSTLDDLKDAVGQVVDYLLDHNTVLPGNPRWESCYAFFSYKEGNDETLDDPV